MRESSALEVEEAPSSETDNDHNNNNELVSFFYLMTGAVGGRKTEEKVSSLSACPCSNNNGNGVRDFLSARTVCGICIILAAAIFFIRSNVTTRNNRTAADSSLEVSHFTYEPHAPHTSSFGGPVNTYKGTCVPKTADSGSAILPKPFNAHAVPSLSVENFQNLYGHYVHDEFRSPYASHLYKMDGATLEEEQHKYEEKMTEVRRTWGYWNETESEPRSQVDFSRLPYRDMPADEFPADAWQRDKKYVRRFIAQGKSLVERVLEGIYAEYGHPKTKPDGTLLNEEELKVREMAFRVRHDGGSNTHEYGVAELSPEAWQALQRKLLHAMMTHDEFYVVLGGHSSAGHGNNFPQSSGMVFHHLMEPIFDKLGFRLITRNMAQGGVGTFPSALGGADIYGERDIFIWDSAMTEGGGHLQEFFNRQAILAGERVPILFTSVPRDIVEISGGWVGKFTLGWEVPWIAKTKSVQGMKDMPFAIQGLFCTTGADFCSKAKYKFSSTCWEDRSDVEPSHEQTLGVSGQVRWHPGEKYHLFQGRWLCLVVLKALQAAFQTWEDGLEKDGFPLADAYWHVGDAYRKVKGNLRRHIRENPGASECEEKFQGLIQEIGRICNIPMHAYGEWTPRVTPEANSLRSIVRAAPNGYVPYIDVDREYRGADVLPHVQRIPDGHVDVHAIAIATNREPPEQIECSTPEQEQEQEQEHDGKGEAEEDEEADRGLRTKPTPTKHSAKDNGFSSFPRSSSKLSASSVSMLSMRRSSSPQGRSLVDDGDDMIIVPGQGWSWSGLEGFCDGSSMSECGRGYGSRCLMSGHNDARAGLIGDALSGWLVMDVPNVKHGLILLRIEWWVPSYANLRTEDWTLENNGKTHETEPPFDFPRTGQWLYPLSIKKDKLPDGFLFDLAVDGKVKTMNAEEFLSYNREIGADVALWPALNEPLAEDVLGEADDDSEPWRNADGRTYEVAIRVRVDENSSSHDAKEKRAATIKISHVYYA